MNSLQSLIKQHNDMTRTPISLIRLSFSEGGGKEQEKVIWKLEIALDSGKLDYLVKDVRQKGNSGENHARNQRGNNGVSSYDASDEPLVVEAEIEGYLMHRIFINEQAAIQVMFEHCFNNLCPSIKARPTVTQKNLVEFLGEELNPLGKIDLEVSFGTDGLFRRTMMKFPVVQSMSPYNIILGRTAIKELHAIPSTTHDMIKKQMLEPEIITEGRIRIEGSLSRVTKEVNSRNNPQSNPPAEEIMVNLAFSDQLVIIGRQISKKSMLLLIDLLKSNKDLFVRKPSDMTGIPKLVIKHTLNANMMVQPVAKKMDVRDGEKSSSGQGGRRMVEYPTWISYLLLVKKVDDTWQMCIEFKNINSAYPKDYDPLPEIDLKIKSAMGCIKGLPRDEEVDHRVAILNHPKAQRNLVHLPRGVPRRYFLTEIQVAYKGTNAEVYNFADEETKHEEWTMYTDGASSTKGVGAGLVLIDPSGVEYTYTRRLNFTSSNNEAVYEALLAGLRIAQKMKVSVLSKLASVAFNHLTKEILVEVLNSRSIDVEEVNAIIDEEGTVDDLIIRCLATRCINFTHEMPNDVDLLYPSPELEKRTHKQGRNLNTFVRGAII
nr:hypothetical protein [Tanacetum cinerariifolium]